MTRLQEIIIQKVALIKDEALLQEINRLLETGAEEEVYMLSPEQEIALKAARQQIKNGDYLTEEEANKQTKEWLKNR